MSVVRPNQDFGLYQGANKASLSSNIYSKPGKYLTLRGMQWEQYAPHISYPGLSLLRGLSLSRATPSGRSQGVRDDGKNTEASAQSQAQSQAFLYKLVFTNLCQLLLDPESPSSTRDYPQMHTKPNLSGPLPYLRVSLPVHIHLGSNKMEEKSLPSKILKM